MSEEFIHGLDELLRDLEELPRTLQRKYIARALREAAQPIAEAMRERAPDDPKTPRSRIKDNIGINVTEQTSSGAIALIGPAGAGFVAGFTERGTKNQPRRPFIGPAFDDKVKEAVEILSKNLGDAIENELKK